MDIIVTAISIIIKVISMFQGWSKGFKRYLYNAISFICCIVVGIILMRPIGNIIYEKYVEDKVGSLVDKLNIDTHVVDLVESNKDIFYNNVISDITENKQQEALSVIEDIKGSTDDIVNTVDTILVLPNDLTLSSIFNIESLTGIDISKYFKSNIDIQGLKEKIVTNATFNAVVESDNSQIKYNTKVFTGIFKSGESSIVNGFNNINSDILSIVKDVGIDDVESLTDTLVDYIVVHLIKPILQKICSFCVLIFVMCIGLSISKLIGDNFYSLGIKVELGNTAQVVKYKVTVSQRFLGLVLGYLVGLSVDGVLLYFLHTLF